MATRGFAGIAPQMGTKPPATPPIMDPQMKPAVQPQAQAAVSSAPMNPAAARDVALRNLGTQTAAAPSAPAVAPADAATPDGVQTMAATAAPAGQDYNQRIESYLTSHPEAQARVDAIANASPGQHMGPVRSLLAHFMQNHGMGGEGRGQGGDDSEYSREFDRLDREDRRNTPVEQPMADDGEAQRREAARIKRMRASREQQPY